MQSILYNVPGNLRDSPTWSRRSMSSTVGRHRYSEPKTSITPCTNFLGADTPCTNFSTHSRAVLSATFKYSSSMSAAVPYASIRITVVHFCSGDNPRNEWLSTLKKAHKTTRWTVIHTLAAGTGTWARFPFRELRLETWNGNIMEHRSQIRWNTNHI